MGFGIIFGTTYTQRYALLDTYPWRSVTPARCYIHKRRNESQPENVQEPYNFDHSTFVYVW